MMIKIPTVAKTFAYSAHEAHQLMYQPKPALTPSCSAITKAPNDDESPINKPLKIPGNAEGRATLNRMYFSLAPRTRAASTLRMSVDLSSDESIKVSGNHTAIEINSKPAARDDGIVATAIGSHAADGTGPMIFIKGEIQ